MAFLAAAISAMPVLRPREYNNEPVGGGERAYFYFNDEGVDLYRRNLEIARYYEEQLEPAHEVPCFRYLPYDEEAEYPHLDWVGRDMNRDERYFENSVFTRTMCKPDLLVPVPSWIEPRCDLPNRLRDLATGLFSVARTTSPRSLHGIVITARLELFSDKPDLGKKKPPRPTQGLYLFSFTHRSWWNILWFRPNSQRKI